MYNQSMPKNRSLILIILLAILTITFVYLAKTNKEITNNETQTNNTSTETNTSWKKYTFDNIGLSFSAPSDMEVNGDQIDSNGFTMTIQRSTYPDPKYYQLYASLQPEGNFENDAKGLKEQLADGNREIVVGGFKAIQGQYKGERNRYVTFIFTDRGVLTVATSQPTPENERITNSILDTFSFTKKVTDTVTSSTLQKSVQEFLAKKYKKSVNEVNVTVKKEVSGYASGSVLFGQGGPGEGGMWLAVLDNDWDVVWDGNGSIDCVKMRETFEIPDSILKPNFCD